MKKDLISLARQQVFEEYITKRQQIFEQWLKDADVAWKEKKINLPYPEFNAYPNDEDIYNRIEFLHKIQKEKGEADAQEKIKTTKVVGVVPEEIQKEITPQDTVEVTETEIPVLLKKIKGIL